MGEEPSLCPTPAPLALLPLTRARQTVSWAERPVCPPRPSPPGPGSRSGDSAHFVLAQHGGWLCAGGPGLLVPLGEKGTVLGWLVAGRWRAAGGRPPVPFGCQSMASRRPPLPRCPPPADSQCLSQTQTWILFPNFLGGHPSGQGVPCPQTSSLRQKPGPCVGGGEHRLSRRVSFREDEGTVAPEVPSAVWLLGVQGRS